jgi:geranylgeranyl diphosphate synthase type I
MRAMTASVVSASVAEPDDPQVRFGPAAGWLTGRVTEKLADFLRGHTELLLSISPDLAPLAEAASTSVLDGGKRLRPTFAYWGWRSGRAAGADGEDALVRAASSLELLQACALVHDDVMDASDTRRGRPAAHIRFESVHRSNGWPGAAPAFGASGAILLGDLLLSWAEEMFSAAIDALPADRAGAAVQQFDLMRTEVVAGQFLDVLAQTRGAFDPAEALRVIRFKTSKYTIVRPLLLGAGAAGAAPEVGRELAAYGHALGEAFQLRDDLLGVFGDPAETGKPAGDDLREGKRTLLVARAVIAADDGQRQRLFDGIGNAELTDDEVDELRRILTETGARDSIEHQIAERAAEAVGCLGGAIREDARAALLDLADAAAHRSF